MEHCEPTGRIFDIQKCSLHDGPGIRTLVFFQGCPLSCWWCCNPEGLRAAPVVLFREGLCEYCGGCVEACGHGGHAVGLDGPVPVHRVHRRRCVACGECALACCHRALRLAGRGVTVDEVVAAVVEDSAFYAVSGGGVTLGGGEPLAQPRFATALLSVCRARGIHTAVETSGFARWEVLEALLPHTDCLLVDLKHMDSAEHEGATGQANTLILDNLRHLLSGPVELTIRIPFIPGFNDSEANLFQTAAFIARHRRGEALTGVDLLPLHRWASSKYLQLGRQDPFTEAGTVSDATLQRAARILASHDITATIEGVPHEPA